MAKKKKNTASGPTLQKPVPSPLPTKGKRKETSSSPIACIIPDLLYLSPVSATGNEVLLERARITHVISIGRNPWAQVDGITYYRIGLKDEEGADIKSVVERVCEIMDEIFRSVKGGGEEGVTCKGWVDEGDEVNGVEVVAEKKGGEEDQIYVQGEGPSAELDDGGRRDKAGGGLKGKGKSMEGGGYDIDRGEGLKNDKRVLFHCSAAISRSPAVLAGYLMKRRGLTLRESLVLLVKGREAVSPNVGFMRQLCEMEREVFGLGEGDEGSVDVGLLEGGGKLVNYLVEK